MSNYDPNYGGYPPQGYQQGPAQAHAPQADDGFILPDEHLLRGQIERSKSEGVSRNQAAMPRYVKVPPPQGLTSWRDASPGEESSTHIWLCPAFAPGRELGFKYFSHFAKVSFQPQGLRIACGGRDCKICETNQELRNRDKDLARELRRQQEDLYNVVHCSKDADHLVKDGEGNEQYRSAVVAFGLDAHRALMAILAVEGARLCHPRMGRVLQYGKVRNSNNRSFGHTLTLGQYGELPQHWWDLCRPTHMWDLAATYPPSSAKDQEKFLEGMGLKPRHAPAPSHAHGHAPQQGYPQQAPQRQPPQRPQPPRQNNRYDQPPPGGRPDIGRQYSHPPPQGQGPQRTQQPAFPPPQASVVQPPAQAAAPASEPFPYDAPPSGGDHPYGGAPGNWGDPPPYGGGEPPPQKYPAPAAQPAQQSPAPPRQTAPDYGAMPPPPPNYSAQGAAPSQQPPGPPPGAPPGPPPTYAPVASGSRQGAPQGQPPRPPAGPSQAQSPGVGQGHSNYMRLTAPLPPNVALPQHRERCFGKFDPQHTLCVECPPWIKAQCQPQTPGFVPPGAGNTQVQEFADKMRGG